MAEREIKTVLTLDDASFKNNLSALNADLKSTTAEMELAVTQSDGLGGAFKEAAAKVKGLTDRINTNKEKVNLLSTKLGDQKDKLAELKKALEEATTANGEGSKEAKKAADEYQKQAKAVSETETAISNAKKEMAIDKGTLKAMFLDRLGEATDVLKKLGEAALTAGTAVAGAVGSFALSAFKGKDALDDDVLATETIFGDYADFMKDKATEAWRTTGMSTEGYLERANELGILLQSYGMTMGDSANMASNMIARAADISALFGNDINEVIDAMTAAAAGRYKQIKYFGVDMDEAAIKSKAVALGFAETTEEVTDEMKALAAMQMILDKTNRTEDGFANKTNDVKTEFGKLEAAWSNLLNGTGDGEDVAEALGTTVTALGSYIEAEAPRVIESFSSLITNVAAALPGLVQQLLPTLSTTLTDLLTALVENADDVGQTLGALVGTLVQVIIQNLPTILDAMWGIIKGLFEGLWDALYKNMPDWMKDFLKVFGIGVDEAKVTVKEDYISQIPEEERQWLDQTMGALERWKAEGNMEYYLKLLGSISKSNFGSLIWDETERHYLQNTDELMGLDAAKREELMTGIIEKLDAATNTEKLEASTAEVSDAMSNAATSINDAAASINAAAQSTGSHAGGLERVPFDNYMARLHRGEMVLTAAEAAAYRAQRSAGNVYNDSANIYIDKYNQYSGADADALLRQMQAMTRRTQLGYGM